MTPLNNEEINKLMGEVAVLMDRTNKLEAFKRLTEIKDDEQDKAILKVENRCSKLEEIYLENKRWIRWVFWAVIGLILENVPANLDATIWNIVHKFSEK